MKSHIYITIYPKLTGSKVAQRGSEGGPTLISAVPSGTILDGAETGAIPG
jgi:hypothetical protein